MNNFILAFLSTLLVIVLTPPTHKPIVHEEAPYIKKYSVLKPLEAKAYAQKQEMVKVPNAPQKAATAPQTGNCAALMAQAGIANTNAANALIAGESGCQAGRLNPSSYACGIAQSLPCTKMYPHATKEWIATNKFHVGGKWFIPQSDPVHELRWMKMYVDNRYGSFESAYSAWLSRSPHWY